MGSIYLTWLADQLRAAGGSVKEYDNQWKTRSRSSGGFSSPPLGVSWHHTAGATGASAQSECDYMVHSSDARPTCNIYIARDGVIWVLAAGATNTSGKGGPLQLSRGTVPLDSANTTTVGMEIGNNGTGEAYSEAQIDAAFLASNVINRQLGNSPADLFSHNLYAPTRKIDPATAEAVQGRWKPTRVTGSGTWSTEDIRAEALNRAGGLTPPVEEGMGTPCVAVSNDGVVRYFVVGSDHAVYQCWWDAQSASWSGWQNLGGQAKGDVSAVGHHDSGRIDICVEGMDGQLWQNFWVGGASWNGWAAVHPIP